MKNITYNFIREPRGSLYIQILNYGLRVCSHFILVVRDSLELEATGTGVLEKLEPFLVEECESSEWPGTVLFGSVAKVYKYRYDEDAMRILQTAANGFLEWQEPKLPEDLCLLRPSGAAWLVTIAHEGDVYLEIDEDEWREILSEIPQLEGCVEPYKAD